MSDMYLDDLSPAELGEWMKRKSEGAHEIQTSIAVWKHIADRLITLDHGIRDLLATLRRSEEDGR